MAKVSTAKVMQDKGVKIMLDKERTLKFDMNTLCELEESGMGIEDIADGLSDRSFSKIRVILHAMLSHEEDETFTLKKVGTLVTMQNLEAVVTGLGRALTESMPAANGDEGNEAGK